MESILESTPFLSSNRRLSANLSSNGSLPTNYTFSVLEQKWTNTNRTPITFLLPLQFLCAQLATWCRQNDSCWPPMQQTCRLYNVEVPPAMHLLLDVVLVEIQHAVQFNCDSHCNSLPRGSRAIVSVLKDKFLTVPTINRLTSTNQPLNEFQVCWIGI